MATSRQPAGTSGGIAIEDVTGREDGQELSGPGEERASLPAVAALAIGWQVAELAATVADDQVPLTSQVLVARPLVRTIGHRLRQLGLYDRSGAAVSADGLGDLVAAPELDRARVLRAVLALHSATLEGLSDPGAPPGADLRHAYELGKALAQSSLVAVLAAQTGQPSLYRRLFDAARLLTVAEWLAVLRNDLPEHAADAVFHSLRSWCEYVARASDEQLETSGSALRSQSRIWRDLLFDRRLPEAVIAARANGGGAPVAPQLGGIEAISLDAAFAAGGGDLAAALAEPDVLAGATVLPPGAPLAAPPAPAPAAVPGTGIPDGVLAGATVLPPGAPLAAPPAPAPPPGTDIAEDGAAAAGLRTLDRVGPDRSWLHRLASWALVLVLALGITVLLRTFVVQPFSIPSGSMFPTLQVGDRILVDKLPPAVDTIHLGDIIVFRRVVADQVDPNTEDLVKRVVGLPGQTIWSRGDAVILDGKPLAEPWLPVLTGECAEQQLAIKRQTIPPDNYFVLGDCRGISYDSRYWGTVPASHVIGKVFLVVWRHDHPWFHWF